MNKAYVAVAIDHKILEPADPSKAPSIGVRFRVVEGPDTGAEFLWYGSLAEGQAQEITVRTLRDMGWTCNDITVCEGLGSVKFRAVEKIDTYKGKRQVRYNIWPLKSARAELSPDAAASFASQFRALAASMPVVELTESNAAPAELPPAKEGNNGSGASLDVGEGGTPF